MSTARYFHKPESEAKKLIHRFNISAAPVPVHDIARGHGLDVIAYDLGEGVSGTLVLEGGKGFIGYNPADPRKRQRFTVAHELGHYILHHSENNLFVDKDFLLIKYRTAVNYTPAELVQEQEANGFAAALLMPEDFLYDEIKKQASLNLSEQELIDALAKVFDVSVPAMTIRISNLNYLS